MSETHKWKPHACQAKQRHTQVCKHSSSVFVKHLGQAARRLMTGVLYQTLLTPTFLRNRCKVEERTLQGVDSVKLKAYASVIFCSTHFCASARRPVPHIAYHYHRESLSELCTWGSQALSISGSRKWRTCSTRLVHSCGNWNHPDDSRCSAPTLCQSPRCGHAWEKAKPGHLVQLQAKHICLHMDGRYCRQGLSWCSSVPRLIFRRHRKHHLRSRRQEQNADPTSLPR